MIYGANHQPLPPAEIVQRLQQIDPALGLKWAPGCRYNSAKDEMEDGWALTEAWGPEDRRRPMTAPEDMADMIDVLPADCPVDEAYGYVVRAFQVRRGKGDIQRYLDRVHAFNANRQTDLMRPTNELAEELLSTNKHRIRSDAVRKHRRETAASKAKKLREYLDR